MDWRSNVKEGDFVAVAIPNAEQKPYGYARIEDGPINDGTEVLVTLYTHATQQGQRGTIPTALLSVPLTSEQFQTARKARWPGGLEAGRAICNQITNQGFGIS